MQRNSNGTSHRSVPAGMRLAANYHSTVPPAIMKGKEVSGLSRGVAWPVCGLDFGMKREGAGVMVCVVRWLRGKEHPWRA